MVIITSLMFAFNSMIFSKDILNIFSEAIVLGAMVGVATVFIIIIIAWLINYMINFMMQRNSREFGIYLLLGMKKKEVANLFIRENQIIGIFSFLLGILPGIFLQQVFQTIFFSILGEDYGVKVEFNIYGFLLTAFLYKFIYVMALHRNKKKLKKMTINEMMRFDRENENVQVKSKNLNIFFFFVSIIYIICFDIIVILGKFNEKTIWIYLILLVASIYLFYGGISSFIVNYIDKRKNGIYKNSNLFLLCQFVSKIKTMQFTMSSLTILFTFAILSGTVAMMFNDFLDKRLDYQLPFDIIVFSDEADYDFQKYLDVISQNNKIDNKLVYNIYENNTSEVNDYLRKEFNYPRQDKNKITETEYFDYDTFMKESDYNRLRKMLGYKKVELSDDQYLIHCKDTIKTTMTNYFKNKDLDINGASLTCKGYYTEAFAQRMHNGADYIIVVPDEAIQSMDKYYSCLAVDIRGEAKNELQEKLDSIKDYYNEDGDYLGKITIGFGSDQIITCTGMVLVQSYLLKEMKFVLSSVSFPFIYIVLVFICVGLTILAVQQISDSIKYKYRYSVLSKLGLRDSDINKIILKQLSIYYLLPLAIAAVISSVLSLYISDKFIYYTGVNTFVPFYYIVSISLLLVVYSIYFVVTYVEFKRNVR